MSQNASKHLSSTMEAVVISLTTQKRKDQLYWRSISIHFKIILRRQWPDNLDLTHKVAEGVFVIILQSMALNLDQITVQIKLAVVGFWVFSLTYQMWNYDF